MYHGRKGQPIVARISLLDTRYNEYQHAKLGISKNLVNIVHRVRAPLSHIYLVLEPTPLSEEGRKQVFILHLIPNSVKEMALPISILVLFESP